MFYLLMFLVTGFPAHPVFSHLTTEAGLSQNTVLSIAQDSDHNMWFATMDAVDRYDGYRFSSYPFDSDVLPADRDDSSPVVFADASGRIYINAVELLRYEKSEDRFIALGKDESRKIRDSLNLIRTITDSLLSSRGISGVGKVTDMEQAGGALWFATTEGGVIGIEEQGRGRIIQWSLQTSDRPICSNYVRSVCYDGQETVWAGTGNGLSLINIKDYSVVNLRQSADRPDGLGNNMIKDIFLDDAGAVWIGSFYGGVDYYNSRPMEFSSVDIGLREEVIGDIAEDPEGRLWIGTGRNGIFRYDPVGGEVNRLNLYENNPEYDDVKSIIFSRDGKRVYVGTGLGGVIVLDYRSGEVILHPDASCPKAVYAIMEEDDRYLWVGSLSGLYLFDTETGAATKTMVDAGAPLLIFSLVRGQQDAYALIGASKSLVSCRLAVENGKPVVSDVKIIDGVTLVQDVLVDENDIWVATRKGLLRIDESGCVEEIKGLPCKLVRGLERDSRGHIWAGTENGLCSISPEDGKVARYGKSDGLVTNSFSLYAHTVSAEGKMYFGGIGGLACFFPQNETIDEISRKPGVSLIVVDGEKIQDWENGFVLPYGKKVIDLYFSVPNYSSSRRNIFYYRLKGSSDDWSEAGPSAQVSLSSLKQGRYTFELKSENAYGVPCDEIYSLPIRVLPPWYLSIVAIVIYILFGVSVITVIIVYLTRRVAAAKDMEIERLKELSKEEISRIKLRQYSDRILSPDEEAFLLKVLHIVTDRMGDESFSVEELASELCMSRGNLHVKMKKITGSSAIKFIQKVRLDEACELLRNTDRPIAEIGASLGFSSPAYFTLCFRRYAGVAPGRYRK